VVGAAYLKEDIWRAFGGSGLSVVSRHVIVIGKTGQLARALAAAEIGLDWHITFYDREACDLSASIAEIGAFAENLPPCDGLIMAAAYTAVDAAEDNEALAKQVNARAPEVFAKLCRARSIPMVHISTDYVFSGQDNLPINPDAQTSPINAYGRSKLAGETAMINSGARAVILRTSWVFDGIGKNFLTTMLRLGDTRESLQVVSDQIGRPTYAGHLAQACLGALNKLIEDIDFQGGTYHISGRGAAISWAEFAQAIFDATQDKRGHKVSIEAISSSDYPSRAKRPAYSILDISAFERDFNMAFPSWKDGLAAALNQWRGEK